MNQITFTLPYALPSLNIRDRQHWSDRKRDKDRMHYEIMAALGGPRYFPRPPWRYVKVTINRSSSKRLDPDNLAASAKSCLDCLVKMKVIEDDRSEWLTLEMAQSDAAPGQGATCVRIEHLGPQE